MLKVFCSMCWRSSLDAIHNSDTTSSTLFRFRLFLNFSNLFLFPSRSKKTFFVNCHCLLLLFFFSASFSIFLINSSSFIDSIDECSYEMYKFCERREQCADTMACNRERSECASQHFEHEHSLESVANFARFRVFVERAGELVPMFATKLNVTNQK